MIDLCPLCCGKNHRPIYEADVPLQFTVPAETAVDGSNYGRMRLVACGACGHLFNSGFDMRLEQAIYRDQPLTNMVVDPAMADRYDTLLNWLGRDQIEGRRVIEIGGGGGYIACLLAACNADVTVYEPAKAAPVATLAEHNVALVNDYWPAAGSAQKADLIICRQVLEHVSDPVAMMRSIRASLNARGKAYLEVPDADYILENSAFPDLHIQHVQYFSRARFIDAAARVGLRAEKTLDIKNGHDFGVLFQRDTPGDSDIAADPKPPELAHGFSECVTQAQDALERLPQPIVLYGATAHAQSFINAVPRPPRFSFVLDDNPALEGRALFTKTQGVPVVRPTRARISETASFVIAAYLHDHLIASKLRAASFTGKIFTIRPHAVEANSLGLVSLYDA